jgi:uncharacterized FlgJ-related protein
LSIDFEDAKQEFERSVLLPMIARLREAIDQEVTWNIKKIDVIKEMIKKIEGCDLVPLEDISRYLKEFFRRHAVDVSDDTIERACGEGRKKKKIRNLRVIDDKKVIEKTTSGTDFVVPPPQSEDGSMRGAGIYHSIEDQHRHDLEEMNQHNGRLQNEELLRQIKDLEDERERARDTTKRLLTQIDGFNMVKKDLERQLTEVVTKYNATKEDFDRLVIKTEELEEALKKTSFPKASELPTAASLWIPAKDIIILFAHLKKARDDAARNWALEKSRVLIEWEANTGRVTGARLEEK